MANSASPLRANRTPKSVASLTSGPEPGSGPSISETCTLKLRYLCDASPLSPLSLFGVTIRVSNILFLCIQILGIDLSAPQQEFNIAPGGYLELLENQVDPVSDDGTLPKESSIHKYINLIRSGSKKMGRLFVDVSTLESLLVKAGFVDVELRIFKWPMNGWPKDEKYKKLGLWCHENFFGALEAVCMALLTRVHGWTRDEVDIFLIDVRRDLKNRSYHAYFPIYSVVGRKPEKGEAAASD
ncbi:hypothetical protein COL516b_000716 [Colletotrichum fioriniae]|nr:uncharacterized protein COL516b_000716 [Colletotrichum fioriniae]KAJ0313772.1 hypothetical protein COL516b_000716 [Colletotrichum fioriniae]